MDSPTQAWQALAQSLVLGTGRGSVSLAQAGPAISQLLGATAAADVDQQALALTAALGVYQRAGQVAAQSDDELAPCESADTFVGPAAARHLHTILYGEYKQLLGEWCQAAVAARLCASPELIPALLDAAAGERDDERKKAIYAVAGARGRWLATMNPNWEVASVAPQEDPKEIWETGTRGQRLAVLESLRQTEPAQARGLIESTWSEESPEDRAAFIDRLQAGLGPDDETFLEATLDDKRKPVRAAAARLLSALPQSAYATRMVERLEPLVQIDSKRGLVKRKGSLKIELPGDLDKAARRDGIEARAKGKMGTKAVALSQIIAATPLAFWAQWNLSPAELVKLAKAGEWEAPLMVGWTWAAARQRDVAWAQAACDQFMTGPKKGTYLEDEMIEALVPVLPCDTAQAIAADLLTKKTVTIAGHRVTVLLESIDPPWNQALSAAAMDGVRRQLVKAKKGYDYNFRKLMIHVARCVDPAITGIDQGWARSDSRDAWEDAIDNVIATVQFRQNMFKELTRG